MGELITQARVQRAGGLELPILSMTMHNGLIDQAAKFKKRVASADTSGYKVVRHGQLVVSFPIDEGVLDFQTMYEAAIVSPAYGVWDLADPGKTDRTFLKRALRSPRAMAYYRAKLRGSTARRRSLPTEVFLALPVPLPPIEGQRRIAAILDQADVLRAKRREALALLDDLTQSIFLDMFGADDDAPIPLGDLVDKDDRINYGVVQPGPDVENGVALIRVSDLRDGMVDRTSLKLIAPAIETSYTRSRIRGTEILLSCVGSTGQVALTSPRDIGSNVARAVARIPITYPALRIYVATYLRTPAVQRYFNNELRTVSQPTLNIKQIAETAVPVPDQSALDRFASAFDSVRRLRGTAVSAHRTSEGLFGALQGQAFVGRL